MKIFENEHRLAEMIRDKVARGLLPRVLLPKIGGGLGSGEPCSGCGRPVTTREPVVQASAVDLHGEQPVRFHVECYYFLVEANRKRPTRAGNSQETKAPPRAVKEADLHG